MKKIALTSIFFFYALVTLAQKVESEYKDMDWHIVPSVSNKNYLSNVLAEADPFRQTTGDMESSKIYLDNDEAIALVATGNKEYGILKMNGAAVIKWITNFPGIPMHMGLLGDKLIVITSPEFKGKGFLNQMDAHLFNVKTGKLLLSKHIYNGSEEERIEPKFFTSSTGAFFKIAIRVANRAKKAEIFLYGFGVKNFRNEYSQTIDFKIYDLTGDLSLISKGTMPLPQNDLFIDCINDATGNIYLSSYNGGNKITVTYCTPFGEKKKQLSFTYNSREKTSFSSSLFSSHSGKVFLSVEFLNTKKDMVYSLRSIDFETDKNVYTETIINKEYKKGIKSAFHAINKQLDKTNSNEWGNLTTRYVFEQGDNIILWREHYYVSSSYTNGYSGTDRYYTPDAIISVYDKNLKEISITVLPKLAEAFGPVGMESSVHQLGDKLYFISGHTKLMKSLAVYGVYDLSSSSLLKYDLIKKGSIPNLQVADPKATLWFTKEFMVCYLKGSGFVTIKKVTTDLQKLNYEN